MSKLKKKQMTIDDLSVMMQREFGRVDKRFEQVDKRFEQVDKRFEQVDKRFDEMEARFNKRIDSLTSTIDAFMKEVRIYRDEQIVMGAKLDRHEKWMHQIAQKLGIKLEV